MQKLDILYLPLHGIRLIEASAGTGKTYNLIIIYLRLLLNLNKSHFLNTPLTPQEILVVTFSKSAVYNLKSRIKAHIRQLKIDCMRGYSNDSLFSKLLSQIHNVNHAINILSKAETEINQASIFTIHGFCQKILIKYTIELNMLFNITTVEQESELYQQICFDFWRLHFYTLPANIISFIQQFWKNPEELLKEILPYIQHSISIFQYPKFITKPNNITEYYMQIITYIKNIKIQWKQQKYDLINLINTYNINRRIYNKKNIKRWVEIIDQWVIQSTSNHIIPNELTRFRSSILTHNKHHKTNNNLSICNLIEQLHQQLLLFKPLILHMTINYIQNNLNINKNIRSKITFDDMINILLQYDINNTNNQLTKKISACYPVIIIDEFQDTNFNQYAIFRKLYSHSSKNSLILIGDPKQSIYGFRGANILTYIKIRQTLHYKYCLNINWRSSPGMVNAINKLFQLNDPFIFTDISFVPSEIAYKNNMHRFVIHNIPQPSMCFWLYSEDKCVTIHDYQTMMARECAITLKNLLHNINDKTVWLENNVYKKKILKISDITILVRNHAEASLIKAALLKVNISTEFLSNRSNIFLTTEAYELLLLLQSILFPKKKSICTALTTIFFGLNAIDIENIHQCESKWEKILKDFYEYYSIWAKNNILSMIQKILFQYKIPEKLLSIKSGKNNLTNILHLGELLNNVSKQFDTDHALVKWLELQVTQSYTQYEPSINDITRINNDEDHIKISTIHKSKGLEFPVTFLPFMASVNNRKNFFHNYKTYTSKLDFMNYNSAQFNPNLLNEKNLSEDLRLLYVAVTRSIYHCSIGIAPIIQNKYHKHLSHTSDLHLSALGYLVQNKTPDTAQSLKKYLQKLNIRSNGDITFRTLFDQKKSQQLCIDLKSNRNQQNKLFVKQWKTPPHIHHNTWCITSYSSLKNDSNNVLQIDLNTNTQEIINNNLYNNFQEEKTQSNLLNSHTFPQGKTYGIFFHNLFKVLNFKKNINRQWLQTCMRKYNVHEDWLIPIQKWIYTVVNTPINQHNLTLSKINPNYIQTEFKFNLLINKYLTAQKLNQLCKYYDNLSLRSSQLNFTNTTGMLQGFIDLVFYWNNKYYLLDYKTNWLGENNTFYTPSMIESNMVKYHYALQYQLYTVALHRFLQHKIDSYDYEKDFGGVYYLYIRGMNGLSYNQGVYFHRPYWEFIKKLDILLYKASKNQK